MANLKHETVEESVVLERLDAENEYYEYSENNEISNIISSLVVDKVSKRASKSEERNWLVRRFLREGDIMAMYSTAGNGKTWLGLNMAIAGCNGLPIGSGYLKFKDGYKLTPLRTTKCRWLYVDFEMTDKQIGTRIAGINKEYFSTYKDELSIQSEDEIIEPIYLNLSQSNIDARYGGDFERAKSDTLNYVINFNKEHESNPEEQIKCIMVDCFYKMMPKNSDPNSSVDVAHALAFFEFFRDKDYAVIYFDHTGKSKIVKDLYGQSGSSAKANEASSVVGVGFANKYGPDDYKVDPDTGRNYSVITATFEKSRGDTIKTFYAMSYTGNEGIYNEEFGDIESDDYFYILPVPEEFANRHKGLISHKKIDNKFTDINKSQDDDDDDDDEPEVIQRDLENEYPEIWEQIINSGKTDGNGYPYYPYKRSMITENGITLTPAVLKDRGFYVDTHNQRIYVNNYKN